MTANAPLLSVSGLSTTFTLGDYSVKAVRDVSFEIARGEVLGLIGESGSGKTVTGLSILRLLPGHATTQAGTLTFDGQGLQGLSDEDFRGLRGRRLAMIFQDPVGSFNPAKTIGWHIREAIERRDGKLPATHEEEARSLLIDVGIRLPERVLNSYPHQLSGGMLQRALIAMVIALKPKFIVADEPTTNLDNLVERQILDLIRTHQQRIGASVLFVTHDLAIAAEICDRIAVMYAGEIVETGSAHDVLKNPLHPYSKALLATSTSLENRDDYLYELPGEPGMATPEQGCRFAPRCPTVSDKCRTAPPPVRFAKSNHSARCVLDVE